MGLGRNQAPKTPMEASVKPRTSSRNPRCPDCMGPPRLCLDSTRPNDQRGNGDNRGHEEDGTQREERHSGPKESLRATSTTHGPESPKGRGSRRRKLRRVTLPPHLALIGVATASACIMGRYHQLLTDAKPYSSWLLLQRLLITASSWVGLDEMMQHVLDEYRPTPFVFVASCLYLGLTLANVYEQLKGRPKHSRRLAILWIGSLVSAFYGLWLGRSCQELLLAFIPWGLILASTACVMLHPFEEVSLPQEEDEQTYGHVHE